MAPNFISVVLFVSTSYVDKIIKQNCLYHLLLDLTCLFMFLYLQMCLSCYLLFMIINNHSPLKIPSWVLKKIV
jgi:hypothetical protein